MNTTLKALLAITGLSSAAAQATLIDSIGYGVQYELGALNGVPVAEEELGGVTSVFREEDVYSQQFFNRSARVRGDLATGSIGAQTSVVRNGSSIGGQGGSPLANIKIVDTLTFDLTAFAPGDTVDIDIGLDWEGRFFPAIGDTSTQDNARLSFGLTSEDDSLELLGMTAQSLNTILFGLNPNFQIGDPITFGDIGFGVGFPGLRGDWEQRDSRDGIFRGLFSLQTGKITTVDFMMGMRVFGNADFYNSAHLTFDSPVPFTSASGTFMSSAGTTPDPVSVSEPGTALLLFGGALGLVARARKNRQTVV